jgi:acyl carrier protein
MELIGFIEQDWGLPVPPDDITETNFSTVADIARYVAARTGDMAAQR